MPSITESTKVQRGWPVREPVGERLTWLAIGALYEIECAVDWARDRLLDALDEMRRRRP